MEIKCSQPVYFSCSFIGALKGIIFVTLLKIELSDFVAFVRS